MHGRESGPVRVPSEEVAYLLFVGPRVGVSPAQPAPYELEQADIACGKLVVAPLAAQGEHLDRPRPNPTYRTQSAPRGRLVRAVQVYATQPNLASGAYERAGASAGEVKRLELRGRDAGKHVGHGHVAQPAAIRTAPTKCPDDPALDRSGALVLDQLLADRPGKRLEGLGPAHDAQPRATPNRGPEERVVGEAAIEVAQVIIDTERKAHSLDAVTRGSIASRASTEENLFRRRLCNADVHRLAVVVKESFEHAAFAAQHAVHAPVSR